MNFSDLGGELRLAFPMFRNKMLLLFALIFAVGFSFASYNMIFEFGDTGFFKYLILLFSLPFLLVAIFATIATVYLAFNNLRVSISATEITVLRRLLFIPVFYRQFSPGDIRELFLKSSGSTGQGVNKVGHYKIRARLSDGSNVTLAEDIDGEYSQAFQRLPGWKAECELSGIYLEGNTIFGFSGFLLNKTTICPIC